MSSVTLAVDLAKNVFEIAVSPRPGQVTERYRLNRAKFERFWIDRAPACVVMEACATAHHWGRWLRRRGFEVISRRPASTSRGSGQLAIEANVSVD
jgi:transposase